MTADAGDVFLSLTLLIDDFRPEVVPCPPTLGAVFGLALRLRRRTVPPADTITNLICSHASVSDTFGAPIMAFGTALAGGQAPGVAM